MTLRSVLLVFILCALSLPPALCAQPEEPSPVQTPGYDNARLKTPITLWAKDASLSEVLKVLSERSSMNFVTGQGVYREKITIILDKTPLDEAIDILVRAAGLSYEIIGNSVLIAEQDKLKSEVGQMSYIVDLKYASAPEVAQMISDLTKNVKVDRGGNKLICFTSPRIIKEIEKIVAAIDKPHILVVLETRIIEVTLGKNADMGLDWESLTSVAGGVGYDGGPLIDGFALDKWTRMPVGFQTSLDLMLKNNDARLLMNSRLTTTNNRPASLHIGEIIPYEVQSYNLSTSGGVNFQIQKEEVGVKVAVTPHVNENSQVTLTLQPEVSSIIGFLRNIPRIRTRKTQTTVRVEDGQTIFLAGLLSEEETEDISRLPLLGHIPGLGVLFQHRSKKLVKTNLVIEITPHIIYGSQQAYERAKFEAMKEDLSGSVEETLLYDEKEKKGERSSANEPDQE